MQATQRAWTQSLLTLLKLHFKMLELSVGIYSKSEFDRHLKDTWMPTIWKLYSQAWLQGTDGARGLVPHNQRIPYSQVAQTLNRFKLFFFQPDIFLIYGIPSHQVPYNQVLL